MLLMKTGGIVVKSTFTLGRIWKLPHSILEVTTTGEQKKRAITLS